MGRHEKTWQERKIILKEKAWIWQKTFKKNDGILGTRLVKGYGPKTVEWTVLYFTKKKYGKVNLSDVSLERDVSSLIFLFSINGLFVLFCSSPFKTWFPLVNSSQTIKSLKTVNNVNSIHLQILISYLCTNKINWGGFIFFFFFFCHVGHLSFTRNPKSREPMVNYTTCHQKMKLRPTFCGLTILYTR